ncbi:MAG: lytic murein transglycosylase [Proteobacteria bacterium]|nr:lytic murein transglycosylase [Candidatus Enterousia scatequi]
MMIKARHLISVLFLFCIPGYLHADGGDFDIDRWYNIIADVRSRATSENISQETIDATLKSPVFIPSIVKSDKNQSEFKLTLNGYLNRTVSEKRIINGRKMRKQYPTMLARVENMYGVQPHVILAFWGMESNFGAVKARHKLTDAFLTLMYDGRREKFFSKQLFALMKIADKNHLDINSIYGSWAGAMGHFQFIPTTLAQYGVDGNSDGRIDIINSVGDAMLSAGNYLHKLGWNPHEKIVRKVVVPANIDRSFLGGDVKKTLSEWTYYGITNPDGSAIPDSDMLAGLIVDKQEFEENTDTNIESDDTDVQPTPVVVGYLTYPNFYRIKKWNSSNWYAIAIATLADELK